MTVRRSTTSCGTCRGAGCGCGRALPVLANLHMTLRALCGPCWSRIAGCGTSELQSCIEGLFRAALGCHARLARRLTT